MKKKEKRKVGILSKIMLPVLILGIAGLVGSVSTLMSLRTNESSSDVVAGNGIDAIVALDELSIKFEQTQKLTMVYCTAGSNADLKQYVMEQLQTYSEKVANYEKQLKDMDGYLSDEDMNTLDDTIEMLDTAQQETLALLAQADTDPQEAIIAAVEKHTEWSSTLAANIDKLIENNDDRIEKLTSDRKAAYKRSFIIANIMTAIIAVAFILTVVVAYKSIVLPLRKQKEQLFEVIDDINNGKGDLTKRLTVSSKDEIGESSAGINRFIETLQGIMSKIISNSHTLDGVVGSVASSVASSNDSANDISAIMEELSATMQEVSATTNNVSDSTGSAEEMVKDMAEQTDMLSGYAQQMKIRAVELEKGAKENMDNTSTVIKQITEEMQEALDNSKSVEKVSQLTDEILSISSQTNLLALNASIEAARAGEAGKGFAVVADEIRQLADSSRKTANNIQSINEMVILAVQGLVKSSEKIISYINDTILPDYGSFVKSGQQYSDDAVHIDESMTAYAENARNILERMTEIAEAIEGISQAVEESANGVTDAAMNVDSLVQSISNVNGQMHENSSVARNLKDEAENFVNV